MRIILPILGLILFIGLIAGAIRLLELTESKLRVNQGTVIIISIIPIMLFLLFDFFWFKTIPFEFRIILLGFFGLILFCAVLLWLIELSVKKFGAKVTTVIFLFVIPILGGIVIDVILFEVLTIKELLLIPLAGTIGIVLICAMLTLSISPDALIVLLCEAGIKIKKLFIRRVS